MSDYMNFVSEQIKKQEKNNEQIVLDYWKKVSETNDYQTKYESLLKKLTDFSQEYNLTPQEFASNLLKLEGLGKDQTLKLWVIKAERQNLNEEWKKNYIELNSKMGIKLLPKSGDNSLVLNEEFKITPKKGKKSQSDKSKGIKTFDFILSGSKYPNTKDLNGILVVDKTVKVTGGSQIDVQKEIDNTISHLSNDPLKRKYLILLDGAFFYKYVQENKNKFDNIYFSTTDELISGNV
jgi:hypothetical protein